MSFASDLWNNHKAINNDFNNKFEELYKLINFLGNISQNHCQLGICYQTNSFDHNTQLFDGSFNTGINNYHSHQNYLSLVYIEYSKQLNDLLITPLTKYYNNQKQLKESTLNSIEKCQKKYKEKLNKLEDYKNEYHNIVRELANNLIKFEKSIASKENNSSKEIKLLTIKHELNNILKKKKEIYIDQLNYFNEFRESNNRKLMIHLNSLQDINIGLIDFIKWAMNTFTNFQLEFFSKLKAEIEPYNNIYDSIDSCESLKSFIERNMTDGYPDQRHEFVQYKIENGMFDNLNLLPNVMKNIKDYINEQSKMMISNTKEIKNFKCIEIFLQEIWKNQVDSDKQENIMTLIKDNKPDRQHLLSTLNNFRHKGCFFINENTYKILIELISIILDCSYHEKDCEMISTIIITSQTFYTEAQSHGKVIKKYLQIGLMKHKVFQNKTVWEELIKYEINEQIKKKKNLDKTTKEGMTQIKNIARIKIMTYIFNMRTFKILRNVEQEVHTYFCKLYKIDEDSIAIEDAIDSLKLEENNEETNSLISNSIIMENKNDDMECVINNNKETIVINDYKEPIPSEINNNNNDNCNEPISSNTNDNNNNDNDMVTSSMHMFILDDYLDDSMISNEKVSNNNDNQQKNK